MKHISVLVPEGDSSLSNLEATFKIFSMVNESLVKQGGQPIFKVQLVGASRSSRLSNGLFSITPSFTINEIDRTDLIIIPAVHGDIKTILSNNEALVPWMIRQYNNGAEIASLCIGAFLLAATGLLDGKSCTTHWLMSQEFREMYPQVNLLNEKIMTDENGIYTSGGAYSSLNLILYLIEKFAGRDFAILSAKIFEIDIERNTQSPFIIFRGQKDHVDETVKHAQEYIELNFQEKITVDQLASMFAIGRRSLERRFKKATSNTVTEYIQRVKTEAAKKWMETSRKNIQEVMYDVGYTDIKAFRTIFKKNTGLSPIEYRNKYSRAMVS